MYVTDNASLYAFIDDGEGDDRNAKACAAQVYYVATIRDNAQVRVDGSRHEGLIVGYLQMEGGYLSVDNIGSCLLYTSLDRIELIVEVPAVEFDDLRRRTPAEPSSAIRERVNACLLYTSPHPARFPSHGGRSR